MVAADSYNSWDSSFSAFEGEDVKDSGSIHSANTPSSGSARSYASTTGMPRAFSGSGFTAFDQFVPAGGNSPIVSGSYGNSLAGSFASTVGSVQSSSSPGFGGRAGSVESVASGVSVSVAPYCGGMKQQLTVLLKNYIIQRCRFNDHCCEPDFDETALDALTRMPFLQALQTVEHYSSSVSPRINKRSAYLMGILRGQEAHWEKIDVSTFKQQLQSVGIKKALLTGKDILNLPTQVLILIGQYCLQGSCLPSDFSAEVCISLHNLPLLLALKAVSAYNSNKRIAAGAKGGVVNRSRFFLRLIQNVAEQNLPQYNVPQQETSGTPPRWKVLSQQESNSFAQTNNIGAGEATLQRSKSLHGPNDHLEVNLPKFTRQQSDGAFPLESFTNQCSISSKQHAPLKPVTSGMELNLEELADLDFANKSCAVVPVADKIQRLQREIKLKDEREKQLQAQLLETKRRLTTLQSEYVRLRNLLCSNQMNSGIDGIREKICLSN